MVDERFLSFPSSGRLSVLLSTDEIIRHQLPFPFYSHEASLFEFETERLEDVLRFGNHLRIRTERCVRTRISNINAETLPPSNCLREEISTFPHLTQVPV